MLKPTIALVAAGMLATPALAQQQQQRRYEPVQSQRAGSPQTTSEMQKLVRELNQLIDAADRDKAANPEFLRDLRRTLDPYGQGSSSRTVFNDEFRDGNYTANPAWRVLSGSWRVDTTTGLRSRVMAPDLRQQQGQVSSEQLALNLVDSFLRQRSGQQQGQKPAAQDAVAAISLNQRIANAAQIELMLADHSGKGQFEARLYQGIGDSGYRLMYQPGERGTIAIYRATASGNQVVESASIPPLPLGQQRKIVWTRDGAGAMRVTVNGNTVLQTSDRAFNDPWDGVMLVNAGGEFSIRSISAADRG